MSNLADPWIVAKLQAFGPERLHALGVIALFWNRCEYSLFTLFQEIIGLPIEECWALGHNLGDVAICERIRTIMTLRGFHEETIAQVSNALDYYKVCNQNRNAVSDGLLDMI